ncbi:MAG: OTU domain-containing protein [Myxococcaceae bacterium]
MNKLLFIFLIFSSSTAFSGEKEMRDLRAYLQEQYPHGGCPEDQLERLYLLYVDCILSLSVIPESAVTGMAERLSGLSTGDYRRAKEFAGRFHNEYNDRRSLVRQQSMLPPSHLSMRGAQPSAIPVRSIFEESVSVDQMWDRIWFDYSGTNAKETKAALRTVLQFLANTAARKSLASGEVVDFSNAGQNLYKWLNGFWTRRLTKTADSDSKDAEELQIFARRWQAVMAFARAHKLLELIEQLESLRRTIEGSYLVQSKMTAANRVKSMAPSECRFPDSREQSLASQFSHATAFSHRDTTRSIAPQRSEYEFDVEENAGGGDCLFLALGTTRGGFIRQVTANLPAITDLLVQAMAVGEVVDLDNWLNLMLNGGYNGWGGHFELALFAHLNNVRIVIFQPDRTGAWDVVYQDGPATADRTIFLGRTTVPGGEHYVRLNPRREMTEEGLILVKRFQKDRIAKKTDEEIRKEIIRLFDHSASTIQNLEIRFDVTPNLANAQVLIDSLNASGETISAELRAKLLAAGFKITGSKGKYVITQVEQTGHKHGRDDKDPSSGAGAAGGGGGAGDTTTAERAGKKSRTEPAAKSAPKGSKNTGRKHTLETLVPYAIDALVLGTSMLHGIQKRFSVK